MSGEMGNAHPTFDKINESPMKITKYLWIFSIVFLLVQGYFAYKQLPDWMATHFDTSWKANAFSSKDAFFKTWYLIIFFTNGLFCLMPFLISRTPKSMINVPNKDYWFSTEERKKECFEKIQAMLFAIAFGMNITMGFVIEIIVRISNGRGADFSYWFVLIFAMGIPIFAIGYALLSFRKPKTCYS